MKKYETPYIEKVEFDYEDQVVVASSETRVIDTHFKSTGHCKCNSDGSLKPN